MIEQREYEAFRAFPAVTGTVSPIRPIDVTTGHARVTLQGTGFSVRIQISNAQPGRGDQPHLFLPPDASFETFQTVTPDDPPTMIPAPVRWLRLIVDAGVITGGNVAESSRTGAEINERLLAEVTQTTEQMRSVAGTYTLGREPQAGDPDGIYRWVNAAGKVIDTAWRNNAKTGETPALATRSEVADALAPVQAAADTASNALGNLTLTALNTRTQADGPQLVDGSRWVWQASGTANGGTVVAASGGGVWVREYTGPMKTGWGVGLPADAPAEITAPLTRTTRYGVPDGLRVRGVGRVASVISASGAAAGATIVSTTPAPRTDGTETFYAQGGENFGSVTLDGTGAGANVTGLAVEGSYKTVRDITVRRFTTGVRMGLTHCFANNVDTFDIHNNDIGVAFPVGVTNSGERVTFSNGTIFNNLYNLVIDGPEWFIHLVNVSLDYPNNAHMAISNPTTLHMTGGHIEGERPLVYGVNANQKIGHITVTGATLVQIGADWRTITWNELFPAAGGTFCRGTLFLRDCVEGFSKQRVNRVLTHYVPPAAPVAGTTYTNESAATLHVAITLTLGPGDALLRVGGVVRDRAGISAGSMTTTLRATVPPGGTFLLETAGTVTGVSGQYDLP